MNTYSSGLRKISSGTLSDDMSFFKELTDQYPSLLARETYLTGDFGLLISENDGLYEPNSFVDIGVMIVHQKLFGWSYNATGNFLFYNDMAKPHHFTIQDKIPTKESIEFTLLKSFYHSTMSTFIFCDAISTAYHGKPPRDYNMVFYGENIEEHEWG